MEKFKIPLNLTPLEPHQKCQSLFASFDALKTGESFVVEHDQDPVYLYHHLMEARADPFDWERLKDGPLRWQVRITKSQIKEGFLGIGKTAAAHY